MMKEKERDLKARQCPNCRKDGISGLRYWVASHEYPAVCSECGHKFLKFYPVTFMTIGICIVLYKFMQIPVIYLWPSPLLATMVEAHFAPLTKAPSKSSKVAVALKIIAFLMLGGMFLLWLDRQGG